MTRVLIAGDPFAERETPSSGRWPCRWVACGDAGAAPFVTAYRLSFTVDGAETLRAHVTADERYELFLDGQRVGRGPERGDVDHWFFETYDLTLARGEHVLVARVWTLGPQAPFAQMSLRPGFLFAPDAAAWLPHLGTGHAPWEAKRLSGYTFADPSAAWGTGANVDIDGAAFPWDFEWGQGDGWKPVTLLHEAASPQANDFGPGHRLRPATLPPMLDVPRAPGTVRLVSAPPSSETHGIPVRAAEHLPDEAARWASLLSGTGSVVIPPHTRRRVLWDLENYFCAYPEAVVSGGAGSRMRLHWQETLFDQPNAQTKGDRDAVEGKYFVTIWHLTDGIGDMFRPDGGAQRRFETLWWQCGRYVEILIETEAEPLTLERLTLRETRYPLEMEGQFAGSDARLSTITPLAVRALQMCSHETYMDCPYYEQLMYVGDTRLEALSTYALTRDDRLPRKALAMFHASILENGLTQSRYPSRVRQIIPPFSLWWAAMVHDFALWRDDPAYVRDLMPGVRGVADYFLGLLDADGLLGAPVGWNYMDWVPSWKDGDPPDGHFGISGVLNWQFVLVLTQVAQLEDWAGEPELAARARRHADALAARVGEAFWDEARGVFADDLSKTHFSEHAQCLALLSGLVPTERQAALAHGLLTAPDLARTTIYFTHYLFETFYRLGRPDALLSRLDLWFDLPRRGLKTTVEMPEPTRSDCHAWGAHPLYHFYASLLGIRPAAPGFREVRIAPQLGPLDWAHGALPHPRGEVTVDLRRGADGVHGQITLPDGVGGTFHDGDRKLTLRPGGQSV